MSTFLVDAFRSPDPTPTAAMSRWPTCWTGPATSSTRGSPGRRRPRGRCLERSGPDVPGPGPVRSGRDAAHQGAPCARPPWATTTPTRSRAAATWPSRYYYAGRIPEAIALHEATLKLREAKLGPDHPDTLGSRNNLATGLQDAGRLGEAIALYEATLKLCEASWAPTTRHAPSRNNLAVAYRVAGRLDEAIALHEATLKLREAKLGPDHPDTLLSRNNLAIAYQDAGRLSEAITLARSDARLSEAKLGPDHPHTLVCRRNLAIAYLDAGRTPRRSRSSRRRSSSARPSWARTTPNRSRAAATWPKPTSRSAGFPRPRTASRRAGAPPQGRECRQPLVGRGPDAARPKSARSAEMLRGRAALARMPGDPSRRRRPTTGRGTRRSSLLGGAFWARADMPRPSRGRRRLRRDEGPRGEDSGGAKAACARRPSAWFACTRRGISPIGQRRGRPRSACATCRPPFSPRPESRDL